MNLVEYIGCPPEVVMLMVITVLLLMVSGVMSASEIAFFSLQPSDLRAIRQRETLSSPCYYLGGEQSGEYRHCNMLFEGGAYDVAIPQRHHRVPLYGCAGDIFVAIVRRDSAKNCSTDLQCQGGNGLCPIAVGFAMDILPSVIHPDKNGRPFRKDDS